MIKIKYLVNYQLLCYESADYWHTATSLLTTGKLWPRTDWDNGHAPIHLK